MPELEFFAVAESLSVDQNTNRLSLFNLVEEIQVIKLPPGVVLVPPQLFAVSSWNMTPDDNGKHFRVGLKCKVEGREAVEMGTLDFNTDRKRQRVIVALVGLPVSVEAPCDLRLEVYLNDDYKASHLISATIAEMPAPPQPVTSGDKPS